VPDLRDLLFNRCTLPVVVTALMVTSFAVKRSPPATHLDDCCLRGPQINVYVMKKEDAHSVPYFRNACRFEIEEGYDWERQNWLWVITNYLQKPGSAFSVQDLARVKDRDLQAAIRHLRFEYARVQPLFLIAHPRT
jgi:hypothetical protein